MAEDWRRHAACRGLPADTFYPERGERFDEVRALCATCPSREPCLEWGLHHETEGIWGGTSGKERRATRQRLGIAVETPAALLLEPQCGTPGGYKRHRRLGEPIDLACRIAMREQSARNNRERTG